MTTDVSQPQRTKPAKPQAAEGGAGYAHDENVLATAKVKVAKSAPPPAPP